MQWSKHRFRLWVGEILQKEITMHSGYSCLEDAMDGGAWWAPPVSEVAEADMDGAHVQRDADALHLPATCLKG